MAFKIGFAAEFLENKRMESKSAVPEPAAAPRRSMVQVYFAERNMNLAYYNDQFDLHCGDTVYVDGKLEGMRGRVTQVSYNFKIKVSDYKRVIAVADTAVNGRFFMAGSHFVTFDRAALPGSKVVTWYKAPAKEDDAFVSGSDDTAFCLDDLWGMNVSAGIAERGHNYYTESRVRYISLDGSKGYAIVEGSTAYEVEFEYRDGTISGLICSCFCSCSCKHEFAAMLQLKEALGRIEKKLRRPICAHRLLCCGGQGRAVRLRHRRQGSRKPHAISAQYVLLSLHLIHRLAALGRQSFRCGFPLAPAQGAKGFEIEPFSNLQHTKCSLLLTGREQTSFYFGPFLSM